MRGFKKAIKYAAAIATAGAMVGAGILAGMAYNLGDLPKPFVNDKGEFDAYVVVGENAATADVVGAITVGAAFAQKAVTQVPVQGASGFVDVTGGKALYNLDNRIHYNDSIASVISSFGEKDFDFLAKGTVNGESKDYTYTQSVSFSEKRILFDNVDKDDGKDANYLINVTTDAQNSPLYNLSLSFTNDLSINDTEGHTIKIFGKTFTIAPESFKSGTDYSNALVLYENSNEVTMNAGDSTQVSIGDKVYNITLNGVGEQNNKMYVGVTVNGQDYKKIFEGESAKVGGITIYVKNVVAYTYPQVGSASLLIGADKWVFVNGAKVKVNDEDIENTYVSLNANTSARTVSELQIKVAGEDEYLFEGNALKDPLFNFKFAFLGQDPTLDKYEKIEFTSNDNQTYIKFVPYGMEDAKSIDVFYYNGSAYFFGNKDSKIYTEADFYKGNASEDGDIIYTKFKNGPAYLWKVDIDSSDEKVTITNLFTDDKVEIPYNTTGTININGNQYFYNTTSNKLVLVSNDNIIEPIPVFETEYGAHIALFYKNITDIPTNGISSASASKMLLPNGEYVDLGNNTNYNIKYNYSGNNLNVTASSNYFVDFITEKGTLSNPIEYKVTYDNSTWTMTGLTIDKTDDSDNHVKVKVDEYGTYITYDTNDADHKVTINYPPYQTYFIVGFGENPQMTAAGSGMSEKVNPIDVNMAQLDTAMGTVDKPVILVGGPAVNKLVAQLADANKTLSLDDWRSGDMNDKAIIQYVEDAFGDNPALIIAGYSAKDTVLASKVVAAQVLNGQYASEFKDKTKVTIHSESGELSDVTFE